MTTQENSACPWCGLRGPNFDESPRPADYCDHAAPVASAERCAACERSTQGLDGEPKWCCYCGAKLTGALSRAVAPAPTPIPVPAPTPTVVTDEQAPIGAIVNGLALADKLEAYQFECEAGNLRLCTDWVEFRRCFECLAEWASTGGTPPSLDIEAAAQKMAECMDYPWAPMPEQGRILMRGYAQAVIDAAQPNAKQEAA